MESGGRVLSDTLKIPHKCTKLSACHPYLHRELQITQILSTACFELSTAAMNITKIDTGMAERTSARYYALPKALLNTRTSTSIGTRPANGFLHYSAIYDNIAFNLQKY